MPLLARTTVLLLALQGFAAAWSPCVAQQLVISPRHALSDEVVSIRVTGVGQGTLVDIRATRADSAGREWRSVARFRASAAGVVDLSSTAPVEGSYSGVQPMGLFTSMDLSGELEGKARYPHRWRDTLRTNIVVE